MAKKKGTSSAADQPNVNTSDGTVNAFNKGMVKDYDLTYAPEGTWNHARNAVNNSKSGDIGLLGNEPANEFCTQAPYTIIGSIPIFQDYFAVFSTDDTNSEIGLFHQPSCTYTPMVNDQCLSFNRANLIIGDAKYKFDCTYDLYWDDGLNPSRKLNIGRIDEPYPDIFNNEPWPGVPYVCNNVQAGTNAECTICENVLPLQLNCEKIRLNKRMLIPCVTVKKGLAGGQLRNGSYYAVIAYSENQQRVTDYFSPSNIQALFSPNTSGSSLEINFSNLDTENFTEFQLVVVHTTDQQTVASQVGFYSTQTHSINFDYISATLTSIPLEYIPLRTPGYDKSEAMYDVNGYLIRVAPTEKFDFNYQPFANQIETEWIMVEQPWDYYRKGGSTVGYMRDEVYAFWIRFVYSDGKKSSSYHIPGREAFDWELDDYSSADLDNIEYAQDNNYQTKVWEVINTAYPTNLQLPLNNDPVSPGQIIASGKMGYWESTEHYPDNKPEVWDASSNPGLFTINANNSNYDLCGKPIRHHKMPSDFLNSNGSQFGDLYVNQNTTHIRVDDYFLGSNGNLTPSKPKAIRLLGVRFGNIKAPRDNQGNIIPGIVGYEILRASRQGNKTVVAKGIVNNMRSYREAGSSVSEGGVPFGVASGDKALYPNYVGNFLGTDYTLTRFSDETPYPLFGNNPQNDPNSWIGNSSNTRPYERAYVTFHSPDTNLEYPFLSVNELKLYGQLGDRYNMEGQFETVPGHPKEKLLTNRALLIACIVGVGIAAKAVRGQRITNQVMPLSAPVSAGTATTLQSLIPSLAVLGADALAATPLHLLGAALGGISPELNPDENAAATAWLIAQATSGTLGLAPPILDRSLTYSDHQYIPTGVLAGSAIITFAYYWSQGIDSVIDLMYAIAPYRDFVLRSVSHLNLHKMDVGNIRTASNGSGNTRRLINDISYLKDQFQYLGKYKINNLFRPKCVGIYLGKNLNGTVVDNPIFMDGSFAPTVTDLSVQTVGNIIVSSALGTPGILNKGITSSNYTSGKFYATTSCMYGALKIRLRNQYGQIESANQITTGCTLRFKTSVNEELTQDDAGKVVVIKSPAVFGGDTYVGRYTEKNTFFYFYDWLYDVPSGTELDYTLKYMISYPRFWADFTKFSASQFMQSVETGILGIGGTSIQNALPSGNYNLDEFAGYTSPDGNSNLARGVIGVLKGAMYLFQSGVRDFFVESEYNIDLREEGELPEEKFFNPYGYKDLKGLFDTNIIKFGNYFNYDISLGVSRTMNNYITWGSMQNRSYDPYVAEACYQYYPFRVIYSLPSNQEDKKDYWQIFLVNNYYDFDSKVTAFKSINRNGAIILLEKNSPLMFNAVDSLQTTSGTKITIGDGGLFSQPLQTLSNADIEFQHGSCQDRLSVINTPAGVYWMSAAQGKIFTVAEGMQPISDLGMKWWFSKYLHYYLLDQFPNYPLVGNPVVGIGCQTTFDNENQILYFSKNDYRVKESLINRVKLVRGDQFYLDNAPIDLGDPRYFDNLSWTISFDPKIKAWLSFHDWHPELGISSIKGLFTTKTDNGIGKIWKHYNNTSKFCNYYGIDYPFEIDYISATGQAVTTTRSIEYLLECYVYDEDGIDRYEVLDFNFDKAVVYNNEQVSGNLRLNLSPKNNAPVIVNYPQIDPSTGIINILFSKEEQKYRFNQFWDFTRNRGEFQTGGILVQQPVWNTELNGYIRTLNSNNINLNKSPFERKKFRHYANHVVLIRTVSDRVKMLLKVTNNKLLNSPR